MVFVSYLCTESMFYLNRAQQIFTQHVYLIAVHLPNLLRIYVCAMFTGYIFMTILFCHVLAVLWVALTFKHSQVWLIYGILYGFLSV